MPVLAGGWMDAWACGPFVVVLRYDICRPPQHPHRTPRLRRAFSSTDIGRPSTPANDAPHGALRSLDSWWTGRKRIAGGSGGRDARREGDFPTSGSILSGRDFGGIVLAPRQHATHHFFHDADTRGIPPVSAAHPRGVPGFGACIPALESHGGRRTDTRRRHPRDGPPRLMADGGRPTHLTVDPRLSLVPRCDPGVRGGRGGEAGARHGGPASSTSEWPRLHHGDSRPRPRPPRLTDSPGPSARAAFLDAPDELWLRPPLRATLGERHHPPQSGLGGHALSRWRSGPTTTTYRRGPLPSWPRRGAPLGGEFSPCGLHTHFPPRGPDERIAARRPTSAPHPSEVLERRRLA